MNDAQAQNIERLEALGFLDPSCDTCQAEEYPFYCNEWEPGKFGPHVPPHKPNPNCESGKRPHCTCPVCWG